MPINVNGITINGGSTILVTDDSSNRLYEQSAVGIVNMPRNSAATTLLPLFNVGMNNSGWTNLGGVVQWTTGASGSGYTNIGNCFNTNNGRFTAPWTGLYLFKHHIYSYGPNSTIGWYYHPLYLVNGSSTLRRPGGTPYRMRNYGMPANYGYDSDCCELISLVAGDYVEVYTPRNGTMQGYGPYSAFAGAYIGS